MHLVGFGLQPIEEAAHAVPFFVVVFFPAAPRVVALDNEALILRAHVAIRHIHRNVARRHVFLKIVLTLFEAWRLPRLHGALRQGFAFIGNDQSEINADHTTETAASVAGTERVVERETGGVRIGIGDVASGAVQVTGIAPCCPLSRSAGEGWDEVGRLGGYLDGALDATATALVRPFGRLLLRCGRRARYVKHEHIHSPLAKQQRGLQRLHHTCLVGGPDAHAILHHL